MTEHTSEITIRRATSADIPLLLNFIQDLAEHEGRPGDFCAKPQDLQNHLFGSAPKAFAVIAECDSRAVGFAVCYFTFFTFSAQPGLYIEDLFVTSAHRGQGIGSQILRHIIDFAVNENCCRIDWCTLGTNTSAIAFYDQFEAQRKQDRIFYTLSLADDLKRPRAAVSTAVKPSLTGLTVDDPAVCRQ